jgi:mRNA interferase HigB
VIRPDPLREQRLGRAGAVVDPEEPAGSEKRLAPRLGPGILVSVRIVARRTLREFREQRAHRDAEGPLRAWCAEASRANWRSPADIKEAHRNASFLENNRVVFNVGGNKYRLVIVVLYRAQMILVRFVGTHAQYDTIDAEEV